MRAEASKVLADTKNTCGAAKVGEVLAFGAECMAHAAALIEADLLLHHSRCDPQHDYYGEFETAAFMVRDGDWLFSGKSGEGAESTPGSAAGQAVATVTDSPSPGAPTLPGCDDCIRISGRLHQYCNRCMEMIREREGR